MVRTMFSKLAVLRCAFVAAAALAVAVSAVTGPGAKAQSIYFKYDPPPGAEARCKNKANRYVACTDRLRAKTPLRKNEINFGKIEYKYLGPQSGMGQGSVRFKAASPPPRRRPLWKGVGQRF
jgi:hypothetical protein